MCLNYHNCTLHTLDIICTCLSIQAVEPHPSHTIWIFHNHAVSGIHQDYACTWKHPELKSDPLRHGTQ